MINRNNNHLPFVQFLVSTKDSSKTINNLLISLTEIKYKNFSILFADGDSKDETLTIINSFKDILEFSIVSKRDFGIYDAWNKLIKFSNAEWVCFIGSDDRFIPKELDEFLFNRLPIINKTEINLVSCSSKLVSNNKERFFGKSYCKEDPFKNMTIANCSSFYRNTLFSKKEFYDKLMICGDYEFLLKNRDDIKHSFSSICISEMGGNGLSNKKYNKVLLETLVSLNKNKCPKHKILMYIIRFYGFLLKKFLNEIFNLRSC